MTCNPTPELVSEKSMIWKDAPQCLLQRRLQQPGRGSTERPIGRAMDEEGAVHTRNSVVKKSEVAFAATQMTWRVSHWAEQWMKKARYIHATQSLKRVRWHLQPHRWPGECHTEWSKSDMEKSGKASLICGMQKEMIQMNLLMKQKETQRMNLGLLRGKDGGADG